MKPLVWSEEKNEWLKKNRGISFESIAESVQFGGLLVHISNPNEQKYPDQHIMILQVNEYVYVVPYVEDQEKRFLKTIFPSRKAKKKYLKPKGGI